MNEAALLAACDAAPSDPVPRLVLADCLEEVGTPGRAVAARLLRQSAVALREGAPSAQGALTRLKNRLSKSRPSAVAWFQWWFEPTVMQIVELHNALDRRRLARFVVRCVRETPARAGGVVMDHVGTNGLTVVRLLERFAHGHDLTEADWLAAPVRGLQGASFALNILGLGDAAEVMGSNALAVADPGVSPQTARWAAVAAASGCAALYGEAWGQQATARELHRRLLHECVPCPFDPEGDG